MNASADRMTASCTLSACTPAACTPAATPFAPSAGIGQVNLSELSAHVPVTRRKLEAGQYLYRAGQPFNALFLVHAGFLKASLVAEDGREQVTGFRMRGELLGVESIGMKTYACDVVALDTSEVWELPYPAVLTACARIPELQAQLTAALAAEIRSDRSSVLLETTAIFCRCRQRDARCQETSYAPMVRGFGSCTVTSDCRKRSCSLVKATSAEPTRWP